MSEVILSPHMGYVEEGMVHKWCEEIAENVKKWLEGGKIEVRLK